ncbi:MAG: hypothetical protein A3B66_02305 [Alphaproteobacteria bacterium RIFCSPHIGHO2_02_FULL_46_13]|nr:MAG: hypothetical protein A3B66_02305 [Alphaproteobacteria bacterium RIFCSPHIGHO2_02_FULL_46_13]
MNAKSDFETVSPEVRAQELVSYLEQKLSLPTDISDSHRPQTFQNEIEEIFTTAEKTLKEIKGQNE